MPKRLRRDLGGALREFTTRESHCFAELKVEESTTLFTSQERQWLVLLILQSLRADKSDVDALKGKAHVVEGQSIGKLFNSNDLINMVKIYILQFHHGNNVVL